MSAEHMRAGAESEQQARTETATCVAPSCWSGGETVRVGERKTVLCETHRKAFLGVSS